MSLLSDTLKKNIVTTEIKSMASYLPGIIVGEGQILYGKIKTYNVKVYRGNIGINGYSSSTTHLNVPISSLNNTTKAVELSIGDHVLLGKLNNDENSLFIVNGGSGSNRSNSTGMDGGNPEVYIYTGTGEYITGTSDTKGDEKQRPIFGTAQSSFGSNVFIRGDSDDPLPETTVFNNKTYKIGETYTYMNWDRVTSYKAGGTKEDNSGSRQALLRWTAVNAKHAKLFGEGYWMIGNRFCVAMTDWYANIPKGNDGSAAVGSICDIYLRDGTIIPIIIGDIKAKGDSGRNVYGHNNGACVIEFITNWPDGHENYPAGPGVKMVVNGGNYFDDPNLAFVEKL